MREMFTKSSLFGQIKNLIHESYTEFLSLQNFGGRKLFDGKKSFSLPMKIYSKFNWFQSKLAL